MRKAAFAVVGIRNFAQDHIRNIMAVEEEGLGELRAVVVRDQDRYPGGLQDFLAELEARGVVFYRSYEELLEKGRGVIDIITLPVALHTHYDMAKRGMEAGFNLVLEKPPVPTVQQLDELMEVEGQTGTFCSIGFQMIHSRSLRRLKQEILAGKLGEIREITCRGYWPRDRAYYSRNKWAGRSIVDGMLVMDGPMHNALAHYLNNMLFVAGPTHDESAELRWVRAEMYRSRQFIRTDDTSCLEAETTSGTGIYFYVTHSPQESLDPIMEVVGTKGTATWYYNERAEIRTHDGEVLQFDSEGVDPWVEVMRVAARVQRGELAAPYATLGNSRSFVVAINAAYDSARYIRTIPSQCVEYRGEAEQECAVIKGIDELLNQACRERKLLSDLNVPWAVPTKKVNVEDYREFNPFFAPDECSQ